MCIQPCCHGKYIYGNTLYKIKAKSGATGKRQWTGPLGGTFPSAPASADLDMYAKRWYYSRDSNQIRYVSSGSGIGETVAFSVTMPNTNYVIHEVRVFPTIGKILYCAWDDGVSSPSPSTTGGFMAICNYDGSSSVTLSSVTGPRGNVAESHHGTVNLATNKVIYIRRAAGTPKVTTLRQCDLDGSNDTQLLDISTVAPKTVTDQYRLGGLDYDNQYIWFSNRGYETDTTPGTLFGDFGGLWRCSWTGTGKTRVLTNTAVGRSATEFLFWGEARPNRRDGRVYYWLGTSPTAPGVMGVRSILPDGTDDRFELKAVGVQGYSGTLNFQSNCILGEGYRNKTDLYS